MSGAEFILAINMFVAALLAAAFLVIAAYGRDPAPARWMAGAYLVGMAHCLIELAIAHLGATTAGVVLSFSVILGAMGLFNVGLSRHYRVGAPWRAMAGAFALSVAACWLIQDMPRDSMLRMTIYQAPFFVMQMIGAAIIWAGRKTHWLDRLFLGLLAASGLHFLTKPFLSRSFGGTGATAQDYLATTYALFSQSMGTMFAMAVALMAFVIMAREILVEATTRSELDILSRLLNRGGFERGAEAAIRRSRRQNVPLSVVVGDLDHFKRVNDTWGHASGDRVIEVFAQFLKMAAPEGHVAGRIGGEEFAVVLPGSNILGARLFAEGARSAFSAQPVAGLPADARFTVSFGAAELAPGESLAELLERADQALYAAKRGGRDCVRLAAPPQTASLAGAPPACAVGVTGSGPGVSAPRRPQRSS